MPSHLESGEKKDRYHNLIERIVTVNHAWKLSREEFGQDFPATKSFRGVKSSLQADLIREFPEDCYLVIDPGTQHTEDPLYSVRLQRTVVINNAQKSDAEHLPCRIAEQLLTPEEIENAVNRGR
ncbi:hypothetical protein [Ferrimonas balearica]|uniref:hypothetical protein n=1 Tax=Ferrimonas balearica TaxID=44012 RepID=UPI001F3627EE|nr:hypothetical protein [Ferrimonas balearica]MBY6093967.1 hypothetical protein [Ferrimonas balearica]